jgi:hypothetical protein
MTMQIQRREEEADDQDAATEQQPAQGDGHRPASTVAADNNTNEQI